VHRVLFCLRLSFTFYTVQNKYHYNYLTQVLQLTDIALYMIYTAERVAFISLLIVIKTISCFTGVIFLCGNADTI
jgi:hypothetical protein